MTLNGDHLTSAFIQFNLSFFRKPPHGLSLCLLDISFSQTFLTCSQRCRYSVRQLWSSSHSGERRYLSYSQEATPDKIPSAPLRNALRVLSWLEGLRGKTFHRWTHLNLSGQVYFVFHILLPDGVEIVTEHSLERCWFHFIDLSVT